MIKRNIPTIISLLIAVGTSRLSLKNVCYNISDSLIFIDRMNQVIYKENFEML